MLDHERSEMHTRRWSNLLFFVSMRERETFRRENNKLAERQVRAGVNF